jgi:hypothetical protein
MEPVANPAVVRIHVAHELTDRTIVTSPPAEIEMPVAGLHELDAVRTLDLHRYRVRVNLVPGADRAATADHVREILEPAWGAERSIEPDPGPKVFETGRHGARVVAESARMARAEPLLEAVFAVDGVAEAVVGEGMILVRIGRLFRWERVEPAIAAVVRDYDNSSGDGIP